MMDVLHINELMSDDHVRSVAAAKAVLAQARTRGAVLVEGHRLPAGLFLPDGADCATALLRGLCPAGQRPEGLIATATRKRVRHLATALLPVFAHVLFSDPRDASGWMIRQCAARDSFGHLAATGRAGPAPDLFSLVFLPRGSRVELMVERDRLSLGVADRPRVALVFGARLACMFRGFGAGLLRPAGERPDPAPILRYAFGCEKTATPGFGLGVADFAHGPAAAVAR